MTPEYIRAMHDRTVRRHLHSRLNLGRWLMLGLLAALGTLVGVLVAGGHGHLVWQALEGLFRMWFEKWR
jgi:hypothetical protein